MSDKFIAHGNTSINIDSDVIIIESTGPWNIEYFYGLHLDIAKAIQQVDSENYAILLIPKGEAIGTPESMEYHIDFLRQGNAKAVAINLSKSETPSSTKSLCSIAYQTVNLTFEFFTSNEQAMLWLNSKLA